MSEEVIKPVTDEIEVLPGNIVIDTKFGEADGTHKTGVVSFPEVAPVPTGAVQGVHPAITIINH
jgi:hypothetical protein